MIKFLLIFLLAIPFRPTADPVRLDNGMGPKVYGCPDGYKGWREMYDGAARKNTWLKLGASWMDDERVDGHCIDATLDPNVDTIKGIDKP